MSVYEYIGDKANKIWDYVCWDFRNISLISYLPLPFHALMRRERGTEFPFYFPNETKLVMEAVEKSSDKLNDFVHLHESERNRGDINKTFIERLKYFVQNYHYYSNDTMANLYFSERLPIRDYQRIKSNFNLLFFSWFSYNCLSGVFLVALNNHFFRSRRTSIPMVFLASLSTMAALGVNYEVSHQVMEKFLNLQVRRLGYAHLIHNKGKRYPRNIDFFAC